MGLAPPPKVEKLQEALHTKAKESPSYRFYALYDKLYRRDVLQHAFELLPGQPGSSGRRRGDVRVASRRMARSSGWTNWRKNYASKRIDPSRSGG